MSTMSRHPALKTILKLVLAAFAALILVVVVIGISSDDPAPTKPKAPRAQPNTDQGTSDDVTVDPTPEPETTPSPSDYEIKLQTRSKACFGSAGCNLEVIPKVSLLSEDTKGKPVSITYKITGGTDGPVISTIDLDEAGKYESYGDSVSTATSASQVAVTITNVELGVTY